METTDTKAQESQVGTMDYAAALRQYNQYGRGRSMRKFCEDEGYDYWKFCKYARDGQKDLTVRSGSETGGFIELRADGTSKVVGDPDQLSVCEVRVRFSNGMVLNHRGGDVESIISALRKILS